MPSFIIVGYGWQILRRGAFLLPFHPRAAQKRLILNRVKKVPILILKVIKNIDKGLLLLENSSKTELLF